MAEYMVLIYDDEAALASADPEEFGQLLKQHRAFMEANSECLRGGNAIQPSSTARSLRHETSGAVTVVEGPYVHTPVALTGYYKIEAADLEEATTIAKQLPAPFGGVEVREVRVFN